MMPVQEQTESAAGAASELQEKAEVGGTEFYKLKSRILLFYSE